MPRRIHTSNSVSTPRRRGAEGAVSAQGHRDTEGVFLESGVNVALRAIGQNKSVQKRRSGSGRSLLDALVLADDGRKAAIDADAEGLRVLRGESSVSTVVKVLLLSFKFPGER